MKLPEFPEKRIALLCMLLIIVSGCATKEAVRSERYFWPPPPDEPRIEWLHTYSSQLDLKMTSFRSIKEAIVGKDAPISIKKPVEVRVDAVLDKIYVADLEIGGVIVFDLQQNELRLLSIAISGFPARIAPIALAIDGDSNLYILEPRYRKILVYGPSEKYIRSIDLDKICQRPVALAIDKVRGRLYVSDAKTNKIFAFDLNGVQLFGFGGPGDSEGAFNMPVGLTIGSTGDIIVADSFNARIQIFNSSGSFMRSFGRRGDRAGDFQLIKSVAVDKDDNIYVVDGRSHSVTIFNKTGDLLLSLGSYYAVSDSGKLAPGGFSLPVGIDIDGRGRIFIVDQLNARIQVFQYLAHQSSRGHSVSH